MKNTGELMEVVRRKHADGTLTTADLTALVEEKKRDNYYAAQHGVLSAIAIDGGKPTPKDKNLVGFFVDAPEGRHVWFLGEDATQAYQIIVNYARHLATWDLETIPGSERMVIARVAKGFVRLGTHDGLPSLRLPANHWNDWLLCIYRSGYGFDAFPLEHAPTPLSDLPPIPDSPPGSWIIPAGDLGTAVHAQANGAQVPVKVLSPLEAAGQPADKPTPKKTEPAAV